MTTVHQEATLPQAPFGRRAAAAAIDVGLGLVAAMPMVIGAMTGDPFGVAGLIGVGVGALLTLGLAVVQVLLTARSGSIGSRALGLGVRQDGTGAPLGIGRALLRWVVFGASGIVPVLGTALMATSVFMDPQRRGRGWHDLAAGAFAVVSRAPQRTTDAAPAAPEARYVPDDRPYQPGQLSAAAAGSPQPLIDSVPGVTPVLGGAPQSAPAAGYAGAAEPGPVAYGAPAPAPAAPAPAPEVPAAGAPYAAPAAAPDDPSRWRPGNAGGQPVPQAPAAPEIDDATVRRAPATELDDDLERTRVARRGPTATVRLDGDEPFFITGVALFGRNPAPAEGEVVAHLVPLGDTSRTVSKTHLAVAPAVDGVQVIDRGSTNGSALVHAGLRTELQAGRGYIAVAGDVIELGDHRLEVIEHAG